MIDSQATLCVSPDVGGSDVSTGEFLSSSEQSGAHSADRAVEDLGGTLVGHVEHLRQHERLELRPGESGEHAGRKARLDPLRVAHLGTDAGHETSLALTEPDMVCTDVPADAQQPRHHRRVTAELAHRADRTEVGLLHEVLDLAVGTQRMAQLPHVRLGEADELGQSRIITFDRP